KPVAIDEEVKGVILSGSPFSVNDEEAPQLDVEGLLKEVPVLGICYGAQLTAKCFGGEVARSKHREYGRAKMIQDGGEPLFEGMSKYSQIWMSHGDSIVSLPESFKIIATTESIPVAAFRSENDKNYPFFGLQFHPEVYHSTEGEILLKNYLVDVCHCSQAWTPAAFVTDMVHSIREKVGNQKVIMALSGGVDSTVAASLIQEAVGEQFAAVFVDNGLLRKDEFEQVLLSYHEMGLNVVGVDAKERFYKALHGVTDPEEKRKIKIGRA